MLIALPIAAYMPVMSDIKKPRRVKKTIEFPPVVWEIIEQFRFNSRIRFEGEAVCLLVIAGADALSAQSEITSHNDQ